MACNCWTLYAVLFNRSQNYTEYFCAQTARFEVFEGNPSLRKVIYVDCQGVEKSLFIERLGFESGVLAESQLVNGGSSQPPQQGNFLIGSCDGCLAIPYDCVNHACRPASQYGTPGIYQSLAECEQNCGSKGCSGKCVPNNQWAIIEGTSINLKNQSCK
ncbi:MAG: hypothetical protein QNJ51_25775 [Calothrix sp. MO_167.B12]|nr:hypothetical protein [Calothrix sp. MO_167.B12]